MNKKKCSACSKTLDISMFHKAKAKKDGLRSECKSCKSAHDKAWREVNSERHLANAKSWNEANSERKKVNDKAWLKNNLDKHNASNAKYRAAKLQATGPWTNTAKIQEFYTEAKRLEELTGIEFHVDHIYALQGVDVCGLHTHHNLQILTATDNISKGNR